MLHSTNNPTQGGFELRLSINYKRNGVFVCRISQQTTDTCHATGGCWKGLDIFFFFALRPVPHPRPRRRPRPLTRPHTQAHTHVAHAHVSSSSERAGVACGWTGSGVRTRTVDAHEESVGETSLRARSHPCLLLYSCSCLTLVVY